jgi:hypothetical protein
MVVVGMQKTAGGKNNLRIVGGADAPLPRRRSRRPPPAPAARRPAR